MGRNHQTMSTPAIEKTTDDIVTTVNGPCSPTDGTYRSSRVRGIRRKTIGNVGSNVSKPPGISREEEANKLKVSDPKGTPNERWEIGIAKRSVGRDSLLNVVGTREPVQIVRGLQHSLRGAGPWVSAAHTGPLTTFSLCTTSGQSISPLHHFFPPRLGRENIPFILCRQTDRKRAAA